MFGALESTRDPRSLALDMELFFEVELHLSVLCRDSASGVGGSRVVV